MMSREVDILLVGYDTDRFAPEIRTAFRHWQVYNMANPGALFGRRFRRAYVTDNALQHSGWTEALRLLTATDAATGGHGEILPFSEYREPTSPEVQDLIDMQLASDLRRSRYAHN